MASVVDQAKLSSQEDLLEIEKYTKGLIKFIDNSATPITIGIQGEWGSGKTSLLNTIREALCEREGARHYAIWLNTWEYSLLSEADETLIKIVVGLIEQIGTLTQKTSGDSFKKVSAISKALLFRVSKSGGMVGMAAGVAADMVDGISSEEKPQNSIRELRESLQIVINEAIEHSDKRAFIFFIDDLDRLDPTIAVNILELIKNLFDLHNCIFVLAIDYSVVIKGLQSKFGEMTEANEWEFRAFFDKIIQLPFSMPISSYNISKYLQSLLINVNYFKKDNLENKDTLEKIANIVSLSVGTNPRALKRLANSVSLIEIIRGEQEISLDERIIEFALICVQIAYSSIYKLIQKETDFKQWDDAFVYGVLKNKKIDESDLELIKDSEEFDEEWEQNLWKICQINTFLKERVFLISKLLNFIKDNIPKNKNETASEILERLLSMSSVTNVSAESTVMKSKKRVNYGKPLKEYIFDVYQEMSDDEEIMRDDLEKRIADMVKKHSGLEVKPGTLAAQTITMIVNEKTRAHYFVTQYNHKKLDLFYYIDENTRGKKAIVKKFLPDNPPVGCRIYYKNKETKEVEYETT